MILRTNVLKVGATRKGKSESAAREIVESPEEAVCIFDPHKQSLAERVFTHATGNVLYERLSNIKHTLGFDLLKASRNPDALLRQLENQRRAEAFVEVLLRRRDLEGMAGTPLMEEWVMAAIMLYLFQPTAKPLPILPFAFLPSTPEFASLVSECELPDICAKFQQLEKLSLRALRAEVGSASRLLNAVFRSLSFQARCRGGFNLGGFLQKKGTLIVERGEDIGDDPMRVIMGAIILLVIDCAKSRAKPHPPIRIVIDEATNARLVGSPELRGIAETNKNGLFWTFLVQNLDFPDPDAVLQNCLRHEWFGCPNHKLARIAATDVVAGLSWDTEESRAERIARLTDEIMNLPPGYRWVRDPEGSRKEYVEMLQNPWPDWPGLRERKLLEKLTWIYARPEYQTSAAPHTGVPDTPPSMPSSSDTPPPPPSSPKDSSPAARWKRARGKPDGGSRSSDGGSA